MGNDESRFNVSSKLIVRGKVKRRDSVHNLNHNFIQWSELSSSLRTELSDPVDAFRLTEYLRW